MIPTGVSGIDELLEGGIPEGSRVLYSMEPGVDGQLFMISTLYASLSAGRKCLVIVPYTSAAIYTHEVAALKGADPALIQENVVFLDSTHRLKIRKEARSATATVDAWKEIIRNTILENAIDTIFVYFDLLYEDVGLKNALDIILTVPGESPPAVIVEHLNLEGEAFLKKFIHIYHFDLVGSIKSAFRYIPFFNCFTLLHTSWTPVKRRSIPFMTAEGRIIPYIPKIVVTGPAHSGKSTFVTHASDYGESVDRAGVSAEPTTVAMDYGWLHWRDFDITLYGTPGERRFDPIIPQLIRHAMGVVLVIDVTDPGTFERARDLIRIAKGDRLPLVIAANKSDLPHDTGAGDIRHALGIRDDVPVHFISSMKKSDVRHVIEFMVDYITRFAY